VASVPAKTAHKNQRAHASFILAHMVKEAKQRPHGRTGTWSDLGLANWLDHPFKQMLEKRILTAHKTHVTCFVQLVA